MNGRDLIAALVATTFLTAGVAYAADQTPTSPPQQTAAQKDASKLSADATRAYGDVALTRLAIFDGRVKDAKKFITDADTEFGKAKTDDSVFLKAEADMKMPKAAEDAEKAAKADSANASSQAGKDETAAKDETTQPKRWLPVDAEMIFNEDFTANPKKAAAVADANKSLAKGDKQGAMAKLKLADVNVDYIMAVVPLDQTLTDVHQAAQLVDSGKYYEASQMLRQVQDSTRYDMLDVNGVPGKTKTSQETPATR